LNQFPENLAANITLNYLLTQTGVNKSIWLINTFKGIVVKRVQSVALIKRLANRSAAALVVRVLELAGFAQWSR